MSAPAHEARGLARWLPIASWLPRYQGAWLPSDLIAALTVWAVVVPQAIAYAQIAGLPPAAGLVATIAGLAAYAVLGTSRQLIVSPTSSTAAISAALVAPMALGDPVRFAALSATLAILCGLALGAFGLLKMGFLSRFIAPSVQAGFMVGLGLTIIAGQIPKLIGTPSVSGDFITEVEGILPNLAEFNAWTLAIGIGSLAALFLFRRYAPALPGALIVVVASILLVSVLDLADRGVDVLGSIDSVVPTAAVPDVGWADVVALIPGALIIAIIGVAEALTIAERFADEHRYQIRPDQELVASGASNIASGFLGAFMIAGGASQSAANDRAGAKTLLAGAMVAVLVLATLLFLLPIFANLPQAVLAAIVITAVLGFVDFAPIRRIGQLRRDALVLALLAGAGVIFLGVLPGLVIAVAASIGAILVRLAKPSGDVLGQLPGSRAFASVERHPEAIRVPGVLVYRLNAPLMMLNAKLLRERVDAEIYASETPIRAVVIDMTANSELDVGTVDVLAAFQSDLARRGIAMALGDVVAAVREMLARSGLEASIGPERVHRLLADAVASVSGEASEDQ
ncbi:MAG TPA: SulP family inorganic anion transporter [Candidatus Limnocylindria bacterium]